MEPEYCGCSSSLWDNAASEGCGKRDRGEATWPDVYFTAQLHRKHREQLFRCVECVGSVFHVFVLIVNTRTV